MEKNEVFENRLDISFLFILIDFTKWNQRSQAYSFFPIYRPRKSCASERVVDFGKKNFPDHTKIQPLGIGET